MIDNLQTVLRQKPKKKGGFFIFRVVIYLFFIINFLGLIGLYNIFVMNSPKELKSSRVL